MALASRPAKRALAGSGRLGLGGCGAPRRGAYEWGVRSTRKPEPRPLDRVYEIPGLDPITYEGKMHFMPGLARPLFQSWEPDWSNPRCRRSCPIYEQPLYKEQACYVFHQRCRLLEAQSLWTVSYSYVNPRFSSTLLWPGGSMPKTTHYRPPGIEVRGASGCRLSAKDPLPPVASREEIEATKSHVLETFYPISPTIDLQECHVYDVKDNTGFREGYPYPHPHTLYFLEKASLRPHRFQPDQLRAKMLLFAFGNALAQARLLFGDTSKVLEQPIVVQSVGTDGRVFQFLVLQLNTTDLASNEGVKNLVWVDSDQVLYQHFWCLPVIRKKVVVEPVGPVDFQSKTFKKFLALHLHGAV